MKQFLKTELQLHPQDSKTNVILPFMVEEHTKKLVIRFSYAPKRLQNPEEKRQLLQRCIALYGECMSEQQRQNLDTIADPVNLITVSVDCCAEYLGCAHRQDTSQCHEISAEAASPGFVPHPITAGAWRVVLNVHAVVTPAVTCRLEVAGEEADI